MGSPSLRIGPSGDLFETQGVSPYVNPALTYNAVSILSDPTVTIGTIQRASPTGIQYTLAGTDADFAHVLLARVVNTGVILASTPIHAFWSRSGVDGYDQHLYDLPDGSRVVSETIYVGDTGLPPDATIKICLQNVGAVFQANGENTLYLTAADFNNLGIYQLIMILLPGSGSVNQSCHTTLFYQGTRYLGGK